MTAERILASGPIHAPASLAIETTDGVVLRAPSGKTKCGLPLVDLARGVALRFYGGKVECPECRALKN